MGPPPVSITSQINPVHDLAFYVLKIYFKIILPSTPTSSDLSLFFRFPYQNAACFSLLRHGRHIFHSFQVLYLITYSTKAKKKKYQKLGTPKNTFKATPVQKCSTIKVYNALAVPILLY
jgi:hypothetical protein